MGGRSSRMGGIPKGTLRAPDGAPSLVERLVSLAKTVETAATVLVGQRDVYAHLDLPMLADEPAGVGPLGGLMALLSHAERGGFERVLAVACDLPYVSGPILERLIEHAPEAMAVAPHYGGQWQTLCARYATASSVHARRALSRGEHSLQGLLADLGSGACKLPLTPQEQALLRDWDSPDDIDHDGAHAGLERG
ncbi:MAG TPA: molybdenum cofactor guanylyltransferase [Polyangiaceae bacterium]|nr:molybdenum cofactor guanylyltransferase [Polyangiaceae bacterium]